MPRVLAPTIMELESCGLEFYVLLYTASKICMCRALLTKIRLQQQSEYIATKNIFKSIYGQFNDEENM